MPSELKESKSLNIFRLKINTWKPENSILAKAFSFWLAFLQRDLTWSSNVTLLSLMNTQLSYLLLEMAIPPMLI